MLAPGTHLLMHVMYHSSFLCTASNAFGLAFNPVVLPHDVNDALKIVVVVATAVIVPGTPEKQVQVGGAVLSSNVAKVNAGKAITQYASQLGMFSVYIPLN